MNYKVLFSIFMIITILIVVFFMIKKYRLTKKQIIIFLIFSIFWSSVSIIRAYRKAYALDNMDIGGLALSIPLAVQITSAYGLISFLLRFPIFIVSDIINKRKIFIQLALIILTFTSFWVVLYPSYNSLYFSSLAMGLCASTVALFNIVFSETFKKDDATVSVSILSLAPLLGEFVAAPIQYIGTYNNPKNYYILWLVSGILALSSLLLTALIKENKIKNRDFSKDKFIFIIKNKSFIFICFIALIQSFSKFATTGSNMIVFLKNMGINPLMLAYSDVVFALPQLIGGLLVGTYLIKKFKIERIVQLGIFFTVIFFIITLTINNPYVIFITYILNGLGYGLLYNALISIALQYFNTNYRNLSMGFFQLFFSAGIFYGDRVYKTIFEILPNGLLIFNQSKTIFFITTITSIIGILLCNISIKLNKS